MLTMHFVFNFPLKLGVWWSLRAVEWRQLMCHSSGLRQSRFWAHNCDATVSASSMLWVTMEWSPKTGCLIYWPFDLCRIFGMVWCSFCFYGWGWCLCELTDVLTMHRAAFPHSTTKIHLVQATWSAEVETACPREKQVPSYQFYRLSAPTPLSSLRRVELPSYQTQMFLTKWEHWGL